MIITFIRPAVSLFLLLSGITGIVYPLLVTGLGQWLFPQQIAGSLIGEPGNYRGSRLIGQSFTDPRYFWGRPSATSGYPYNATASGGSNFSPLHPNLRTTVKARIAALRAVDPANRWPIPVDLVTASGSGLDPHISPEAAQYQVNRVARWRGLDPAQVQTLVQNHTTAPQWGLFGEDRVNVLELNKALAAITVPANELPHK